MDNFQASKDKLNLFKEIGGAYAVIPVLLLFGSLVALVPAVSRDLMLWLLEENHPVEFLSFLLFILSSGLSFRLGAGLLQKKNFGIGGFFLLFGLFLFLVGMEEVSWGQHLFGFETPASMKQSNAQGEMNFHNVKALQGKSEWFRLLFGVGGLIGCGLHAKPKWKAISPSLKLLPWFGVISFHAFYDVLDDFINTPARVEYAVQRSSEMVELLIAVASFLFVFEKIRLFRRSPQISED